MMYLGLKASPRKITIFLTFLIFLYLPGFVLAVSLYKGKTSVFISYENALNNLNLNKSPKINLSFDGSDHYVPFTMDTGSVGLVASEDIFHPAPDAKNLGPGQQYYSSSGIIEEGTWWTSTVKIHDADGNLLATAEVPVLRVTSVKCKEHARSCRPEKHPKKIAMLGIGFGRENKQQPHKTPAYNAFLNLKSVRQDGVLKPLPSDWCNGYLVTPNGIHLGLTAANTAHAAFVKLIPWNEFSTEKVPEWHAAPMTIIVNGRSGNGNVLMDTGVDTAYLTPPQGSPLEKLIECHGSSRAECAPNGTVIHVYFPNQSNPVAHYTFTIGKTGNPMQPSGVHVVKDRSVFLNTSRHILGGINFLYDNTNGYVGYIWNGRSSSQYGYVNQ